MGRHIHLATHLSVDDLEKRYRAAHEPQERSWWQILWLWKPTARPTLRWLFQCFEGVDLHHTLPPSGRRATEVLRLTKVHRLVLRHLGPTYENCYLTFQETAE